MNFTHSEGSFAAQIDKLVVAGWTGRNADAVAHHIAELQDIGVPAPSTTPLFYQVSRSLLVQSGEIDVLGPDTSGEAEPFLVGHDGALWLGLASDHTDRAMEARSVAGSKQACPKICAETLWLFDQVAGHLDELTLKSWISDGAEWELYQEGTLATILPLAELLAQSAVRDGTAMLCGTLPAIGAIRAAKSFRAELADPVLGRSITLEYAALTLEIVS